ncbi:MAG: hypothetical protein GF344_19595 [Chitinivibrionales bacterium]|nr:hypothetical protein [Chitinivibrionales bacterium]MBD3358830.1 hypothetical protein [Chitinivibrionales bacterium]
MLQRNKPNQSAFLKAVVLGAALVLGLVFYTRIPKTVGAINQLFLQIDNGEAPADTLLEAQKDSVRSVFAGFWIHNGSGGNHRPHIHLDDRIELQQNGIIWRTLTETLTLPSGRKFRHSSIKHSYLVPFARSEEDSGSVLCQVASIKRARIFKGDTCYEVVVHEEVSGFNNQKVEVRESTVWDLKRAGEKLLVDGRPYQPYGDPDLSGFFPKNMLGVVDDITVRPCSKEEGKRALVRRAIGKDLAGIRGERSAETVSGIINEYYAPECLRPLLLELTGGAKPPVDRFDVTLRIGPEGEVEEVAVAGSEYSLSSSLKKRIVDEISQWRFRPSMSDKGTLTVKQTIAAH